MATVLANIIQDPTNPVTHWFKTLDEALSNRLPDYRKYSEYYDGTHRMMYSSDKWRAAFGAIFRNFADNWCDLVVDSCEERLNITGFRYPDQKGSDAAWAIWQANNMDAISQIIHSETLIYGMGYVMVWQDEDDGSAEITVESPMQTIVASNPADRDDRQAAFKRWVDSQGYSNVNLYLPNAIYKFKSRNKAAASMGVQPFSPGGWEERLDPNENTWPVDNPLRVVPVVPLVNKPRLSLAGFEPYTGKSEIKNVIPVQDAVNKVLLDMLIASEFTSFRQRWVTGMEIPVDPDTKQAIEPFKSAVDRLFMTENPEAKFGEFQETDLGNYVKAIELMVQHVASQTRTPPHYFYLSGNFPSGEAIKSAETGLVAKTRRKMRYFSDPWEEVMRLAFKVEGNSTQAAVTNAEVIWQDPESHSEAELADALVKRQAIGVPEVQLWEDAGYSPQQITRFQMMRMAEKMMQMAMSPQTFGAAPPTPGAPAPQPQPMPNMPPPPPAPGQPQPQPPR